MTRSAHRAAVLTALLLGFAVGMLCGFALFYEVALAAPRSDPDSSQGQTGAPLQAVKDPSRSDARVWPERLAGGTPSPSTIGTGAASDGDATDPIPSVALPDTATLSGTATWYCSASSACTRGYGPSDLVAAIDPTPGIERGARLTVSHGGASVTVVVVDVCACKGERVIDLTSGAFRQLAPLSRGVIAVTLTTEGPPPTLPATETEGAKP